MIAGFTGFDRYRDRELTLEDLVQAASRGLSRLDLRPEDRRVAEDVDARGVRYYQTIGVIDRPVRYEGRRAIYGYRHLLQLLCVKKLQHEGHPLQLIQRTLAGRSTAALEGALLQSQGEGETNPTGENEGTGVVGGRLPAGLQEEHTAPRLVAAQVAPGVTVTVDTSQVTDAGEVIAEIRKLLS